VDTSNGRESWEAVVAKRSRRTAEKNLYLADMNAAQQALQESNLGRARMLVDRYFPKPGASDLRGQFFVVCADENLWSMDFVFLFGSPVVAQAEQRETFIRFRFVRFYPEPVKRAVQFNKCNNRPRFGQTSIHA
jgi:hypothetical protein